MDVVVEELLRKECHRQNTQLNMIASENRCSDDVMRAASSVFMNKYSEGYPGKRYYQGNEYADAIELLAKERAKQLFGAEHVNVQPNSGSPANMACFFALLKPGDKVLAMDLSHGGHLTHGSPVNFSGKQYGFVHYGVDESGFLDMKEVRAIAKREKPKLILSGFTAYPRKVPFSEFHEIAREVGAYSMADISHIAGLIAGQVHESCIPYTDCITTTTHKTLRGPRSAIIMSRKEHARPIDKAVFPGLQGGPHMHTIAAKAVAFQEAMQPCFREYASQVVKNAKALAHELISKGIKLVSDGTDTHLILVDLLATRGEKGLGRPIASALEEAGIITNSNTIPFDPSTPFRPSGLRIGTAFITTQGMQEDDMRIIGGLMAKLISRADDQELKMETRNIVERMMSD